MNLKMGWTPGLVPVDIDDFKGKSLRGLPIMDFIEAIWAITSFVYSGDNTVEFVRYTMQNTSTRKDSSPLQMVRSGRSYSVTDDMTVTDVARSGHGTNHSDLQVQEIVAKELALSLPELVKHSALLFVDEELDLALADELELFNNVSGCLGTLSAGGND
jgi:hypothetical protein